jgi:hypothetical protein
VREGGRVIYAVGISIGWTMLIVSVDYYDLLIEVIVKQIIIVEAFEYVGILIL